MGAPRLDYDAAMGSPEEPPATPNEGPEVSAARIERERDRLLGVLLSAPPDPRTNTLGFRVARSF